MNDGSLSEATNEYPIDRAGSSKVRFFPDNKVIDLIKNEGKSLARFGDGEFRWMIGDDSVPSFQIGTSKMSERLRETFDSTCQDLLVGIPLVWFKRKNLRWPAWKFHFRFSRKYHREIASMVKPDSCYADSMISRPYMDYRKNVDFLPHFRQVQSIWSGRNVTIVEGANTRFGVGNDLLDNAQSVKRIICPSENAFQSYRSILEAVMQTASKNDLILACLGPTATILSGDLALEGYQSVDIGHFDIEYEWMLKGAHKKTPVYGKYTNEAGYKGTDDIADDRYRSSIQVTL